MTNAPPTKLIDPARPHVILLADLNREDIRPKVDAVRPTIDKYFEVVAVVDNASAQVPSTPADYAVVCGGDGAILRAAHRLGDRQLPVIGVNLGRIGFLADLQPGQLDADLPEIIAGNYRMVSHLMFDCEVLSGDSVVVPSVMGLNEAAVLAGPPFAMLDVQLLVDGEVATSYRCDGLIISTPVGSTAHNLAAGGPILRKQLQAFVISPICPHTLTNRPVVDSADRVYELVVPEPGDSASLMVDGAVIRLLQPGDRVRVRRAEADFRLVEVAGHGYYRTLREKLGWGGRLKAKW